MQGQQVRVVLQELKEAQVLRVHVDQQEDKEHKVIRVHKVIQVS
jgi:hypothetical protein